MPATRNREAVAAEAATRLAESIGKALARIVNRLESLDTEREKAYTQLVDLQQRFNTQVARLGEALGKTVVAGSATRTQGGRRSRKSTGGAAARGRARTQRSAAKPQRSKKTQIRCGICGTPGHNARGHAKWKATQGT